MDILIVFAAAFIATAFVGCLLWLINLCQFEIWSLPALLIFFVAAVIIVGLDWMIMLCQYRKWAKGIDKHIKEIREQNITEVK